MTSVVDRRNNAALIVSGAVIALGCFVVGAYAVRTPIRGWLMIGALVCVVVYLTRPQWMAWIALFLAFASLPAGIPLGNGSWPMSAYTYQVAVVAAIVFLVPLVRLRFSAYVLPGIFLLTVLLFAAAGKAAGHDPEIVAHEVLFLCEVIAGFVLALLIVRANYVREAIRVMAGVLWFSAGMLVVSSLTGLQLIGRVESLATETGSAQAVRFLTSTQTPAMAVLAAVVAAGIIGRGRLSLYPALGLPALIISVMAFSRNTLIILTVAAVVAFVASLRWSTVLRSGVLAVVAATLVAVVVPGVLFLLQHSTAGGWLADQVSAFTGRVVDGISPAARAVDSSTLDRLHEDANLQRAIAEAPVFGHGMGYAYQLPFGKPGTFTQTLGPTYAHNFYLWWMVKAGAVGMASFAAFALTPIALGIRSASAGAKISAAVSAGLLAACVVNPLPLEPASSLVLGMALGAGLAFARPRQGAEQVEPSGSIAGQVSRTSGPTQSRSKVMPGREVGW